jgi:hypothetical protein
MSDDHPIIAYYKQHAEGSQDDVTFELQKEFFRCSPDKRVDYLERLEASIGGEYDAKVPGLRQQAQLKKLHSDLNSVHLTLRKAGR